MNQVIFSLDMLEMDANKRPNLNDLCDFRVERFCRHGQFAPIRRHRALEGGRLPNIIYAIKVGLFRVPTRWPLQCRKRSGWCSFATIYSGASPFSTRLGCHRQCRLSRRISRQVKTLPLPARSLPRTE